jgi:hypothetical protein
MAGNCTWTALFPELVPTQNELDGGPVHLMPVDSPSAPPDSRLGPLPRVVSQLLLLTGRRKGGCDGHEPRGFYMQKSTGNDHDLG